MSDTYTKGIYIKGEEGLSSLVRSSSEDIVEALGYKPASEDSVETVETNLTEHINNGSSTRQHLTQEEKDKLLHLSYDDLENAPNIEDDDSGVLYIADTNDNVVAKVDDEGVHAIGFHVGDEGITDVGDEFVIVDKEDNKAFAVTAEGVRVNELYLGQGATALSATLTQQTETNNTFTEHIANQERHITSDERDYWNDKSFASVTDNPIEVTEDGEFVIVDENDNKGLVLDGTGLTVDKEVYIQTKEGDTNKVAVAKTLEEVQTAIEEIPEWAMQPEKPEYSYSEIQGEYKDILNAPDIEDDGSNEFVIMDQNDVIGTRIGENGIETINDITITYLIEGEGESQTTEVMSVRDKFIEVEEAAADFKTEVQTSIQELETKVGNLSNIMNFRGAFASFSEVENPQSGDVITLTEDGSEWVYDETGNWVEIGTASATDAAVAALQGRVDTIESDLNTATTGLKDRMTAIEDEVDDFKEEVATQFEELPEIPDWALQENKPTYEYDELTTRPQIENYIEDDEFVIADSDDNIIFRIDQDGIETSAVKITYDSGEIDAEGNKILDTLDVKSSIESIKSDISAIKIPTIEVDETVITGEPGTSANVENIGTEENVKLKFTIPQGEKGEQGQQGEKGDQGNAATITIGTVDTGEQLSITNSGTDHAAVFDFVIPSGGGTDETVTLASDLYTNYNIGRITGASESNGVLIGEKDWTLKQMFEYIFKAQAETPTITLPSLSLSLSNNSANIEYGAAVTFSATITANTGRLNSSYYSGGYTTDTGVSWNDLNLVSTNDTFSSIISNIDSGNPFIVTPKITYYAVDSGGTIKGKATAPSGYTSSGKVAKNNLGEDTNVKIESDNSQKESSEESTNVNAGYVPYTYILSASLPESLPTEERTRDKPQVISFSGGNDSTYLYIFVPANNSITAITAGPLSVPFEEVKSDEPYAVNNGKEATYNVYKTISTVKNDTFTIT